MGSHPYYYFTPYQKDIHAALEGLREQEFKAGRYTPAMEMADPPSFMFKFRFPPDEASPAPGARHDSINEALDATGESGTGSILDIMRITDQPDFLAACSLPPDELIELFGTTEPTRERLQTVLIAGTPRRQRSAATRFWDQIGRGQARYIVLYDKAEPSEIFFIGYSVD
jgi:hypothetical protein